MKRPKRKPDFTIRTEDDLSEGWGELIDVWFKEMVISACSISGRKRYDAFVYAIDRYQSTRGMVYWMYGYDLGGSYPNHLFDDDEFAAKDLNQRLESAYKDWLATKELEKMLKAKTKLKQSRRRSDEV